MVCFVRSSYFFTHVSLGRCVDLLDTETQINCNFKKL
jgi:hypothetical protein